MARSSSTRLPEPKPGAGQVLVKTLACGICGSDLHARKHAHRMVETGKASFPAASRWIFPATSCSAMNSAARCWITARARQRKLKPGTRVCSLPALLTPEGPQGIGYSNDNVGGYAERMLLSEALLLEVPNGLAAEHAALTEPLAVGVHAVAKANIRGRRGAAGDRLRPGRACGDRGAEDQGVAPDRRGRLFAGAPRARRKAGRRYRGRSRALAALCDLGRACRDVAGEKAARPPLQALLPALKPALIFECVGVPGLIQQVFEGAPRDARIVVVGVCMETDRSEPMLGIMKELNVQYVLGYTPDEFAYSLRLIAEGAGRCRLAGHRQRRHRRRRPGVRRSRQSGSAHQDHRRAVAVILTRPARAGRTHMRISELGR